jgi:hypothetical protein
VVRVSVDLEEPLVCEWCGCPIEDDDQREHCPPTDEDADTFFQFQFSVVADGPVGERKATFTVWPSFPDARKPNGDRVGGFPADTPEGVRVEINSAKSTRACFRVAAATLR